MPQAVNIKGVGVVQFPDDYTPEQITSAIERDILPRAAAGAIPEPPRPERSTGEALARQGGLTARHLIEGAAGVPGMLADPISKLAGSKPFTQWLSEKLTDIGFPQPETATERVVGDASRGVAGAAGGVGVGKLLAGAAGPVTQAVGGALAAAPGAQATAAAASGAAAGAAREEGADPMMQLAIGMATGFLTPAVIEAARVGAPVVTRAARQVAKPFTAEGRGEIVGATLRRVSADPDAAMASMANGGDEIVEGSLPTAAQAARDPGLLQAERAMAATDPRFATRRSANNAARNRVLDEIAGTPEELAAAKATRGENATANYGRAEGQDLAAGVEVAPLLDLAKRPAFKAAVKKAAEIAAESGQPVDDVMSSVRGLHYVKLALDDMLDTAPQSGIGKTQQRAIAQTREQLVSWLDTASPEYAKARAGFRADSAPVNRMETGQDIQARTRLAGPDVTGEPIISQAKWQSVVMRNIDELQGKLSPDHIDALKRIGADLDRAQLSDSAGRAAGSNTFQNLSTANVIGAGLGNGLANNAVAQSVLRPLHWLYKMPEEQVKDLLSQAMLDPTIARAMMAKASPNNIDFVSDALKFTARARGMALGATVGATAAEER